MTIFFISQKEEKTSSKNLYYQKKFNGSSLDWKNIYLLERIVTKDSKWRAFQFKLLNVLYLNKMLFKFGKIGSPLCFFCNLKDETSYHLFCECSQTNVYGTNCVIFHLTLLTFFHCLLQRVPFLVWSTKKNLFN